MTTHSFQRYTGAGNTFVVLNTYEDPLSIGSDEMALLVQKACSYKDGAGADGLILVNQSAQAPFRMDYYNPDGSTGMLCGNGARCAVQAAREYGFVPGREVEFEVLGAINGAEVLEGNAIRVYFQDPKVIDLHVALRLSPKEIISASYVDVGSQHVVVFSDELARIGSAEIDAMRIGYFGPMIRWNVAFAPVGANANFIEIREDGEERYLRIRTWERGVEAETLACGTGCMSSAIVAYLSGRVSRTPIRLLTQSGEFVTVRFDTRPDNLIYNLSLEGSAIRGEEGILRFDEANGALDIEYM